MKARGLPVPEMYEPPAVETKPPATAAAASAQSRSLPERQLKESGQLWFRHSAV